MLKKQRTTSTNIGFETRKRLRQTEDSLCRTTCLPAPSTQNQTRLYSNTHKVQPIPWKLGSILEPPTSFSPSGKADAQLVSNSIGILNTEVRKKNETK